MFHKLPRGFSLCFGSPKISQFGAKHYGGARRRPQFGGKIERVVFFSTRPCPRNPQVHQAIAPCMRVCDTTAFQTRFGETASRTQLAAPPGSTAPRSRQFGGKIVSFLFLTRIFSKKVWAARRPVPESAAYEAKRRLGRVSQHRKVPLPQGPSNLGGKLRAVNFFLTRLFSRKSGQPGPSNLGGNCEPFFFFDETFFKKFAPESAAYEAKRRLGRVSQHRKVPLPPGPSNLGGK